MQFVSEFGYQIGRSVVLQDPNGNQIEVSVEKEYGDLFFKDGWMGLLDFYNLIVGAWLTISYCGNCLFFIGVTNRSRIEIKYIKYTPPLKQKLPQISTDAASSVGPAIPHHSRMNCKNDKPYMNQLYG